MYCGEQWNEHLATPLGQMGEEVLEGRADGASMMHPLFAVLGNQG